MKKKNNLFGYLLGILLGFIFAIPWLFFYSFLSLSVGYLSILIVVGLITGYKLVNKEIYNNTKTKLYLILSSTIITLLNVWVFMPIIVSYVKVKNISELSNMYKLNSFVLALVYDSILSLVMVIVPSIFLPIDFKKNKIKDSNAKEFLNKVKDIFQKHNAFSKETAVDKNVIKEEINKINMNKFKRFWYTDVLKGTVIKSKKGKWYFKEKKSNFKIGLTLTVVILVVFTGVWNITMYSLSMPKALVNNVKKEAALKTEKAVLKEFNVDNKLIINLPDCFEEEEKNYLEDHDYYQYLSHNINKSNIEVIEISYYKDINFEDIYDQFKAKTKEVLSPYGITQEEDKLLNDYKTIYYKLDNIDKNRYANYYMVSINQKTVEIHIYIDKEKYTKEDDAAADEIVKSLKLIDEN